MKQKWLIEQEDIKKVNTLLTEQEASFLVEKRKRRNLRDDKPKVKREDVWKQLVACLLTSRQPSGVGKPVFRFITTDPFPLSYTFLQGKRDVRKAAKKKLTDFGGIQYTNRIPGFLEKNWHKLEKDDWSEMMEALENLRRHQDKATERKTADFVDDYLAGFGPKQSRNLLQCLGLNRYEIPLDSRITGWLSEFGFPGVLSRSVLSDRGYYCFVLDGFQALCEGCNVKPCILDAAIFMNFEPREWTEEEAEAIY